MSETQEQRNKRRYLELVESMWNRGDLQRAGDGLAVDYQRHDPAVRAPRGLYSMVEIIDSFRAAISDLHYEVHDLIAEGDKLAARWTITGRHTGTLFGAGPTQKEIRVGGQSFNRFVDGKIVEGWLNWDVHGLLEQLGQVAPLAPL
jgi:predicted ester cyclase